MQTSQKFISRRRSQEFFLEGP